MRALGTGLQSFVLAMRALNEVTLRSRKEINHQPKDARGHYQDHPEHGAVHATTLRVARNPDQERDVQGNHAQDNHDEENDAASTDRTALCGISRIGVRLSQ